MTPSRPRAPIVHLHLDLTNHCNFRCEFCFHFGDLTAKRGFMDTGLALRLVDEVADKRLATGLATSVFGEALLHPDFFAIAGHAVRRGLEVTLNTKGGLLDAETSRRICGSGIAKLIVSFNTPDEASWRVNHGPAKLGFEEHVERVRELLDLRFETRSRIQVFLYLMNTRFFRPRGLDIISTDEQAAQAFASWREVAAGVAERHGLPAPPPLAELCRDAPVRRKWPIDAGLALLPGVELVLKEAHAWGNRMLAPGLEAVPTARGFCPLPWMMLTVHWDGDCSLCCLDYNKDVVLGNVRDSTLEEIYGGEKMRRVREGFLAGRVEEPLCRTCLGGVRDRATGEMLRLPQTSRVAHLRNGLRKYGLYRSLQHGWRTLGEAIRR